jgi:hypothetical protein
MDYAQGATVMTTDELPRPQRPRRARWGLAPLIIVAMAVVYANIGGVIAGSAGAASSTGTATVNASVGSVIDVDPQCASDTFAVSIAMTTFASGSCAVNFGSSNNASTALQLRDSDTAAPFLSGGVFANTAIACNTALAGDTVGYKVSSDVTSATVTNGTCATPTPVATNQDYQAVPTAYSTVCTSTVVGQTSVCNLAVGVNESGGDAAAGTYSGIFALQGI